MNGSQATDGEQSSEVARLKQQIATEYLAAKQGLSGLALGTAQHQFITHRMERMSMCHDELKELVGEQEAARMLRDTLETL
jgi:hypothetical protein